MRSSAPKLSLRNQSVTELRFQQCSPRGMNSHEEVTQRTLENADNRETEIETDIYLLLVIPVTPPSLIPLIFFTCVPKSLHITALTQVVTSSAALWSRRPSAARNPTIHRQFSHRFFSDLEQGAASLIDSGLKPLA